MIHFGRSVSVHQLYRLTSLVGLCGTAYCAVRYGWREALAFFLGTAISLGNLWLFQWLATSIEPGDRSRKPWEAGAYIARYLIFFAAGYAIVKSLGVSPLPVIFGLFTSTAAVLLSSVSELLGNLRRSGDKTRRS